MGEKQTSNVEQFFKYVQEEPYFYKVELCPMNSPIKPPTIRFSLLPYPSIKSLEMNVPTQIILSSS